jgi:hydroxypyruvate reductase
MLRFGRENAAVELAPRVSPEPRTAEYLSACLDYFPSIRRDRVTHKSCYPIAMSRTSLFLPMNFTILQATNFPVGLRDKIDSSINVLGPFELPVGATLGAAEAATVRVLITMGTLSTDAAAMDRLPNLGLICCYGSGYEGVDIDAARKRGIMVTHSPAANASSVADLAMALLLAVSRRIVIADKFVRDGGWKDRLAARTPLIRGLTGRKIGVFGLGAIGRKIADRAAAFEAEVSYYNRSQKPNVPYPFHKSLQSLADWADVLMVAVRADGNNRHVVDRRVLQGLGREGIVINIARGSVIDEPVLIELLESGQLGGAGLDVYEREPAVPDSLRALTNVVLTPHIGGGTVEAHEAMQELVVANLMAYLAGQPVNTPVPEFRP